MGKYTVHNDPRVDDLLEDHLNQIVAAITACQNPQSVILYGSLGRGEASVVVEGNQLHVLSDYEVAVVDRSPRWRGLCASLSRQTTARLGVKTCIAWMRPSRLWTNQVKNLAYGKGIPSIYMYETKSGGRTIYGQDLLGQCPAIDPRDIPLRAGTTLVFNRMAEALDYLPCSTAARANSRPDVITWLNKVALACAEALLLSCGQYHYSYAERARRFAATAQNSFAPLLAQAPALPDLICRATAFKLRASSNLYPDDLQPMWDQVFASSDAVFRFLMEEELGLAFDSYPDFPARFLAHPKVRRTYNPYRLPPLPPPLDQKLVDAIRYLSKRRWPPRGFFTPNTLYQVVYALVPVLFYGCSHGDWETPLKEVRQWLGLLEQLDPPSSNLQLEWNYLRKCLVCNWEFVRL